MSSGTVKLTGQDRLWYAAAQALTQSAGKPGPTHKKRPWKRQLAVLLGLVTLKLLLIASSDGIETLTFWLNDTRGLLGWP